MLSGEISRDTVYDNSFKKYEIEVHTILDTVVES